MSYFTNHSTLWMKVSTTRVYDMRIWFYHDTSFVFLHFMSSPLQSSEVFYHTICIKIYSRTLIWDLEILAGPMRRQHCLLWWVFDCAVLTPLPAWFGFEPFWYQCAMFCLDEQNIKSIESHATKHGFATCNFFFGGIRFRTLNISIIRDIYI